MRFLVLAVMMCAVTPAVAATKSVVGYVEGVLLQDVGLRVKAKMDTGAATSSIDAEIIDISKSNKTKKYRRGEKVVFTVLGNEKTLKKTFEREIIRYVRIKKKGGGFIRRPVIEMTFCVGGRVITEEVNLANRENFIYPVLIGRNMMTHANLVVDPSRAFLTKPTCKPQAKE